MRKGEPRMSAADYKLDDADRRILRVLQQDGRITNQDLASACNMSVSYTHLTLPTILLV